MFDYLVYTEQDAQRIIDVLFETIREIDIVDWDAVLEEVQ